MSEVILSLLNIVTHFMIITTYAVGLINILHVIDRETEAHRGWMSR